MASEAGHRPCLVRVVIPHYCRPGESREGHGSTRADVSGNRALALGRCLGAVLALARSEHDERLDIAGQRITATPAPTYPEMRLAGIVVECHLFVTGDAWLRPVVEALAGRVRVRELQLEDPMTLPAAARDYLLGAEGPPADLSLYLEDDLVIGDRLYVDKLMWFCARTEHRFVLMPHRYELTGSAEAARLFVDGPLPEEEIGLIQKPRAGVAEGRFWDGQMVRFDVTDNPHSGSFAITRPQWEQLRELGGKALPFVGPLETAATGTVLGRFPVLKPSWECRDFLLLEHAHPSFLMARLQLPSPGRAP